MEARRSDKDERYSKVASTLPDAAVVGVELYWIPVGAGGAGFVRFNGRIYEAIKARLAGRRPLDLYHAALQVHIPDARFVIEVAPIPDSHPEWRGVVFEGPVVSRWLSGFRMFRYEVRRWRGGVIPDVGEAVGSPQRLSHDPEQAFRLLDLVNTVPPLVWGRDQLGVGDMWSSNSVISWLLACSGLPMEGIRLPAGGRAPGWRTGIILADNPVVGDITAGPSRFRAAYASPRTTWGRNGAKLVDEHPPVTRKLS